MKKIILVLLLFLGCQNGLWNNANKEYLPIEDHQVITNTVNIPYSLTPLNYAIGVSDPIFVNAGTPASNGDTTLALGEGIDFISFGTNDLTQLTLGIDRNNETLASRFNK